MPAEKKKRPKPLSLYPLKFQEVISDVLKVKPEPKGKQSGAGTLRSKGRQSGLGRKKSPGILDKSKPANLPKGRRPAKLSSGRV